MKAFGNERVCPACDCQVTPGEETCPNCGTWLGLIGSMDESDSEHSEISETSAAPDSDTNESIELQVPERPEPAIGKAIEVDGKTLCPHCGSVHSPEARFCPVTGKPIRDDDVVTLIDALIEEGRIPTQIDVQPRKQMLWLLGIVIVLLLFVGVAIVGEKFINQIGSSQVDPSPGHTSVSINVPVLEKTSTSPISDFSVTTLLPSALPKASLTETPTFTLLPTSSATATPVPSFEPVGQIVFTCYVGGIDHICSMSANGSNQQRLTYAEATDFYASWSPDGHVIVFSSRRDGSFQIYTMTADGENETRLSSDLGTGGVFSPAYSPDGSRIVFTRAESGSQNIWIINANGSNAIPLTNTIGNNVDPVWSPDGRRIAFSSNRSGKTGIYIMDADGENEYHLDTGVSDMGGRIDWSPDGRWIAFYAGDRGSRNIYLIAVDGSKMQQMTFASDNLAPSFSPDGNWIAYTSTQDGDNEIFIIRLDGSEVRQLTYNVRPDWQPRWGP